jgi:anti-sigma-K factor RskA
MTEPVSPEVLEELLAGHVLRNLSLEEAVKLEQILSQNPALNIEVSHLQQVLTVMSYAMPEASPSPHLRSALLAVAKNEASMTICPLPIFLPWTQG